MPEEEKLASASGGKSTAAKKATPRRITKKTAKAPAKKASKSAKKQAAKRAGEHPHTNRPRTGEMGVVGAAETPSGVGLEGFRSGDAPKAGSASVQPNAAGGPPAKDAKAPAKRKRVSAKV